MADYITTDTELTDIADAIRARGGTTATLSYPNGFKNAVNNIPDTTYTLTKSGNNANLNGTNGDSYSISFPVSTGLTLTATTSAWSASSPYTQTITAAGVTSSNNIIVDISSSITSALYDAACAAKMVCTALATNSITLTCYGVKPTVNIPINVVILG